MGRLLCDVAEALPVFFFRKENSSYFGGDHMIQFVDLVLTLIFVNTTIILVLGVAKENWKGNKKDR